MNEYRIVRREEELSSETRSRDIDMRSNAKTEP